MPAQPFIHTREILKSIDHACRCYQTAEQKARYAVWEREAGPPTPEPSPPTTPLDTTTNPRERARELRE